MLAVEKKVHAREKPVAEWLSIFISDALQVHGGNLAAESAKSSQNQRSFILAIFQGCLDPHSSYTARGISSAPFWICNPPSR